MAQQQERPAGRRRIIGCDRDALGLLAGSADDRAARGDGRRARGGQIAFQLALLALGLDHDRILATQRQRCRSELAGDLDDQDVRQRGERPRIEQPAAGQILVERVHAAIIAEGAG